MAQSLDQFIAEVKADIEGFATEYRKHHAANPEHYPLVLGDDNEGLWAEFFMDFMTRDTATEAADREDWRMNPCKLGHRDVGAAGGIAHCYQCDEKITAATTQEAFEQWNATHPKEPV